MNALNAQASCPCGQPELFAHCCQPIIEGKSSAKTAAALMRSRFSAHACHAVDYLMSSWWPEQRASINPQDIQAWVEGADWLRLDLLKAEAGLADDNEGWVEFIAHYRQDGQLLQHGERSLFKKMDGQWYFVEGYELPSASQPKKLGRNDPCPCGSGKKIKRCCG